ncbi:uncharacterized protein [Spinacia oleracea]|uniref:Uncharacterized protein n=1 Tax=Spinacia oleracea TaxID=3562 RepID=A0A9R0I971_SPIOL|nr:uncharacterized protein LOC110784812 [Spinacia oleracea]
MDTLLNWRIVTYDGCMMCDSGFESVEHLLFERGLSSEVWQKVLNFLHFPRSAAGFTAEVQWMIKSSKRGKSIHKLLLMFFAESVYSLWLNRNSKVFNQHCKTATELFREIQFRVASRASNELSSIMLDLSR